MKWDEYYKEMASRHAAYRRFVEAIHTQATMKSYVARFWIFMRFAASEETIADEDDYSGLAELDTDAVTDLLERYVCSVKKGIKPITVRVYLAPVELFLDMNRRTWHKRLVHKCIGRDREKASGGKAITNDELRGMIQVAKHTRSSALVHFLASAGARIGSLVDPVLRMRHLKYMPDPSSPTRRPNWCYCITIYEGSKKEYWTFLTPEATEALNAYFWWSYNIRKEELDEESPVFTSICRNSKTHHMSVEAAETIVKNLVEHATVRRTKKNGRYDKAATYMFRKRFNDKLKMNNDINSNIAEKLMAHKRGPDGVNFKPTLEECYAEFVKAIPALTVDPAEQQKNGFAKFWPDVCLDQHKPPLFVAYEWNSACTKT